MNRVRIAVIGAGRLGRFHAKLAAGLDAFDLVGVVDSSEAAREAVAAEVGSTPYADYQELYGKIEAAVVATPTSTHHAVAKDLLARGVNVLVEKPITPTVDEADELVDLAQSNGLALQVGHVERFNPSFELVREELQGARFIQASRTSGFTFRSTDIGVVMDMMIHDIDLALSIAGSHVVACSAMGVSVLGGHEDLANAELRFANGCVAHLCASRVSYEPQRKMQVFTDERFASIDFSNRQATVIQPRADLLHRDFKVESLIPAQQDHFREELFNELLVKNTLEAPAVNAIEEELKDFAAAIQTGRRPRVTGAAARDAVAVAERILDEIDAHHWDAAATGRRGPMLTPQSAPLRRAG